MSKYKRTNAAPTIAIIALFGITGLTLLTVHNAIPFIEKEDSLVIPITLSSDTLTISWVGDMVPTSDSFYNANVFAGVAPYIEAPDLALGNLEGTFARSDRVPKCFEGIKGCFAFRGTQSFATVAKASGFDFLSMVNNHSLDYGKEGLEDSEAILDRSDIAYISQLHPTREIIAKGFRIGILGVSSSPPDHFINNLDYITNNVRELKMRNDFVVVIFHGGAEGIDKTIVPGVNEFQGNEDRGNVELVAHTAIDAGADVVLGNGPHVLRKIEYYNDKLIAYSLGNFVGGNGKLHTEGILGTSGILYVTLSREHPPKYSFVSTVLSHSGIPSLDNTNTGLLLLNTLSGK